MTSATASPSSPLTTVLQILGSPPNETGANKEADEGTTTAATNSATTTELGCRLWTAAAILCAILIHEQQQQQPAHETAATQILEIGAGVGACGFCAAILASAALESDQSQGTVPNLWPKITITDCGPQTLRNLSSILVRYDNAFFPSYSTSSAETVVEQNDINDDDASDLLTWNARNVAIRRLLWEEDLEFIQALAEGRSMDPIYHWSKTREIIDIPALEDDAVFDLVLGSDLLYFSCQEASLLGTLQRRLAPGGRALILQTMRTNNVLVFERFVTSCREANMEVDVQEVTPTDWCTADVLRYVHETNHTTGYKLVRIVRQQD